MVRLKNDNGATRKANTASIRVKDHQVNTLLRAYFRSMRFRSRGSGLSTRNVLFVLPIGIYSDAQDSATIDRVEYYWMEALRREGFEIVARRQLPGSRFSVFFTSFKGNYETFKKKLTRLAHHAEEIGEKFERVTKVVVLGSSIFLYGGSPQPQHPPPEPTKIVVSVPEAKHMWTDIAKGIEEDGKQAGEVAGGIIAVAQIAGVIKDTRHPKRRKGRKGIRGRKRKDT